MASGLVSMRRVLLAGTSLMALALLPPPALAGSGQTIANQTVATVTNPAGQSVTSIAITGSTVTGAVANAGTISPGKAVRVANTVTGLLVNNSTIGGGIANTGTINVSSVGNNALGILVNGSTVSGGITNSGTITANGGNVAIGIDTTFSTVSGGIANTGMIGVSAVNPNAGITTSATGILVFGGVFSGGITNGGTISAAATGDGGPSSSLGIFLDVFGGNVTNAISGVGNVFSGDVVNRGAITARASNNSQQAGAFATGIAVTLRGGGVPPLGFNALQTGGSFTGSIVNSGTIATTATNTGPANANGIAVAVHGGGNDGFSATAIANSTSTGGTFTGSVVNNGAITASASGVGDGKSIEGAAGIAVGFLSPFPIAGVTETQGVFAGNITNTGTITVSAKGSGLGAFGILVGQTVNQVVQTGVFTGAIANSGTITATGTSGASGVGIKVLNAIPGGITNTGAITGSTAAIDLSQEIGGSTVVTQAGGALFGAVKLSANADVLNFTGGTIFNTVTAPAGNHDVVAITGSGATFAPASSVSGVSAFTMAPGSRLTLQVTPTQAASINAGTIALAGTLNVAPQGSLFGFGASHTYTNVFVADPPLSGSFASVTTPITLFQASVSPDPTTANALDVTLALSQTGLAASAQDLTQSLRLGLDAPQVLGQAVQDRLVASGGVLGESAWSGGAGAKGPAVSSTPIGHANLWARGFDQFGTATASSAGVGYDVNRAAPLIGGIDWRLDNGIVAGVAATYVATSANFKDGSHTDVSSYQGAAYVGWAGGPWYATGTAVASFNDFGTARLLTPFGLPGAATSSPSGQSYGAYAEAGYHWLLPAAGTSVSVTPYAGIGYVHATIDSFNENGGFGALAVNGTDGNSFQTTLGVRATTRIIMGNNAVLVPEVRVGWSHEFGDASQSLTASLVGVPGSTFSATGIAFGRDTALVGAGLSMELSPDAKVFVDYDGKLSQRFQEHSVSGGLKVRF